MDLTESFSQPAGESFYAYDHPCDKRFRWSTDNPHSTRVEISPYFQINWHSPVTIGAHDTSYHGIAGCEYGDYRLRGRSLYGNQPNRAAYILE